MTTVSIIGTAGRHGKMKSITKSIFDQMCYTAEQTILKLGLKFSEIELVSGGAALADHIAVKLFLLLNTNLRLEIPCNWDFDKKQYVDNGQYDWKSNPGRVSNLYHRQFQQATGINSLEEINTVLQNINCKYNIGTGFHNRNNEIAKSEYVIAFTFNSELDGGTLDTWNKSKSSSEKKIQFQIFE